MAQWHYHSVSIHVPGASLSQIKGFAFGQISMMLLILCLYFYRCKTLMLHRIYGCGFSLSRLLLNLIYVFGVTFTLSTCILTLASGMKTEALCDRAILLCLAFYLGGKVILYVFICERLRAIRQCVVDRCADLLWQRCFWAVMIIFGQIAIVCFFYPIDTVHSGSCTIGIPIWLTIPILVFDVGCNLTISLIFYVQSRKVFQGAVEAIISPNVRRYFYITRNDDGTWRLGKTLTEFPDINAPDAQMAFIIRKTLVVSIAILFSTITNLVLLLYYNGNEHGWMCFLMCSIDISWNILNVTYLIGLPTHHERFDRHSYEDRKNEYTNGDLSPPVGARCPTLPPHMMPIRRNTQGFFDPKVMKSTEEEIVAEPEPIYLKNIYGLPFPAGVFEEPECETPLSGDSSLPLQLPYAADFPIPPAALKSNPCPRVVEEHEMKYL